MNIIEKGQKLGLIKFDESESLITYVHQGIIRNYQNPEEKIQAQTFLKLIIDYNYPVNQVKQFVKVQMGAETKEADIIIYSDKELKSPFIIVECKKSTITELEFQRAIDQCFSYAIAKGAKFTWITSGIKNSYFRVLKEKTDERESIADIPRFGVNKVPNYKFAKNGGETQEGLKLFELSKVQESELTDKFKQAHQALWGGGELNPSEAFDELDKLIFCKIFDEKKLREKGEPYDFQIIKVEPEDDSEYSRRKADLETSKQLLNRLINLYEEGKIKGERENSPEIFKEGIKLSAEKVRTVVGYLEGVDLLNTDLDSKGRAFETFMGSFFRGDFGQYFTPRTIVSFIVDSLPINNESKILDTSCGSGGFLLHALDKVRKQADKRYPDHDKNVDEYKYWNEYWHKFAEHRLYGIEINGQIARTAKMNMIIHDDGQTNVVTADGLISAKELVKRTGNLGFEEGTFDFIITNPPFGSIVKQTEKAYLHQYKLAIKDVDWLNPNSKVSNRPSQSTEILFMEQAQKYLKVGGILAIVIPDGILTNSSMQYVRNWISDNFRILSVISLPQTAFMANGAGVKSSILFLEKYSDEIIEYRLAFKKSIQDDIVKDSNEGNEFINLIKAKKIEVAKFNKRIKKETNSSEVEKIKKQKQDYIDKIDEEIESKKELLQEMYIEKYTKKMESYPIFMAIVNDIGYDATGKETNVNELIDLSKELARFIDSVKKGEDYFF